MFLSRLTVLLPKAKDHLTKTQTPGIRNPRFVLLVRVVQQAPKIYRLLVLPLVALRGGMAKSLLLKTLHLKHRGHVSAQRKEGNKQQSYPAMTHENTTGDSMARHT